MVEIIKQFGGYTGIINIVICLAGILLFAGWLIKTSLGRNALADSIPRRNNMPPYLPLCVWAGWIILSALGNMIAELLSDFGGLAEWQEALLSYSSIALLEIILVFAMLFTARLFFARRLRGFGFDWRTIGKDFKVAMINLLAILPIVTGLVIFVGFLGRLIAGDDFQMQRNEGLTTIITYPQLSVRTVVFVFAAVIAPVFEEILFRGLFQSMLRSVVGRAWLAVILTSVFFAMLHPWMHWPALFALSMCLGYAYEKSGSLFRPIFIHMLFNAISIILVIYDSAQHA